MIQRACARAGIVARATDCRRGGDRLPAVRVVLDALRDAASGIAQ